MNYTHPWVGNQDLATYGASKYGSSWTFDPLSDHTSKILKDIRSENPALASSLQNLWAGSDRASEQSSYRNRARELARICGESLDHNPGSIDMQIVERADSEDGFQILDFMKKATVLHAPIDSSSDFVDQDAELKKIRHKFVVSGVHTYVAAYRRQLRLFVEMNLPFQLPEQYNCQRIISHLATRCTEFRQCAREFADAVRDKDLKYTYANVVSRFTQCEKRHGLGPTNRGTPIPGAPTSPTAKAMAALDTSPPPKSPRKQKKVYPKGSCYIHPESTTHDTSGCYTKRKRLTFVHPDTGKVGLTDAEICPKHPQGWHPADLCGDPRIFKPRTARGRKGQIAAMVSAMELQQKQMAELKKQLQQNQVMMAAGGQQLMAAMNRIPTVPMPISSVTQPNATLPQLTAANMVYAPQQQMVPYHPVATPQQQSTIPAHAMTQMAMMAQATSAAQQTSPAPSSKSATTPAPRILQYSGGQLRHVTPDKHARI